jgi:ACS family tartrate transporter-like MFS transporter
MICAVTATYAVEFFMPKIIMDWHGLNIQELTWLIMLPPALAMIAQPLTAWSSDRHQERRWHATIPILISCSGMACLPLARDSLFLTVSLFMLVLAGCKAYMPAFWSLPNLFLVNTAAAGSIGFINSIGNLGGFIGPSVTGWLHNTTGSFVTSLYCLSGSLLASATIIFIIATKCQNTARAARGE